MVDLSVIIPSYRAPEQLCDAIRSLAQDDAFAGTTQIIVVDDGSPEYDATMFAGLGGRWLLKLLHLETNRGRASARNKGLQQADGDVVVFLDGDMTVLPGFLQAHAEFHQRHTNAIAVGDIRFGPEIRVDAMTRYVHSRGVSRYGAGPVPFKCFVTGNSSAPRAALATAGGFDEFFVTYGGEDLELGYRLHLQGLGVHYLPQARSLHHDVRSFAEMSDTMSVYGRDSVPLLLGLHPELAPLLRLGFLERSRWHPHRWLMHLALWSPLHRMISACVHSMIHWRLPSILLDYVWWSCRTRGYLSRPAADENR